MWSPRWLYICLLLHFVCIVLGDYVRQGEAADSIGFVDNTNRTTPLGSQMRCTHSRWLTLGAEAQLVNITRDNRISYSPDLVSTCDPTTYGMGIVPGSFGYWFAAFVNRSQEVVLSTDFPETTVPTNVHLFFSSGDHCSHLEKGEWIRCGIAAVGGPDTNYHAVIRFPAGNSTTRRFWVLLTGRAGTTGSVKVQLTGPYPNIMTRWENTISFSEKLWMAIFGAILGICCSVVPCCVTVVLCTAVEPNLLYVFGIKKRVIDEDEIAGKDSAKRGLQRRYRLLSELDPEQFVQVSKVLSEVEMERRLDAEELEEREAEKEELNEELSRLARTQQSKKYRRGGDVTRHIQVDIDE